MRLTAPAIATLIAFGTAMNGSSLSAQLDGEPLIVLRQNQVIPNLGTIQGMSRIAVAGDGTVFTQATITSNNLRYMMRDNFATFVNNLPIPEPGPPALYTARGTFSSFETDANANLTWRLQTSNTNGLGTGPKDAHTGIYFNLDLIHNDLDSAHTLDSVLNPFFPTIDLTGFGYNTFFNVTSASDNSMVINCRLDTNNLGTGGQIPSALIMIRHDGQGNILEETLLAIEDSTGVGLDSDIHASGIPSTHNAYHMAANGNWIATLRFTDIGGISTGNGNDWGVAVNDPRNLIAREGQNIPGIGTILATGTIASRVSINSFGEYVFMLRYNGSLDHIVTGDLEEIASEGSQALGLPSLAPSTVINLETGPPLRITDTGDVFWTAKVSGATNQNKAFMRNQEVVVRKGVSSINGVLIRDLKTTERAYTVSSSGRFWAGLAQLGGGGDESVILVDYGLVLPIPGTGINPSSLEKFSGDARLGARLTFAMDDSQGPGSLPILYVSRGPSIQNSPNGVLTKFGEIFIDLTPGVFLTKLVGSPVTGGPSTIAVNIPIDPALVDLDIYAQGLFLDVGATNGSDVFNFTNGLFIIVGNS